MQDTTLTQSPDRPYHSFLDATRARFQSVVGPLFVAEVPDLWQRYLNAIPGEFRQAWTCNCCKDFIRRYGAIVTINEDGSLSSPIWNPDADAPAELTSAVMVLHEIVTSAKVAGVFASGESELGRHTSGGFRHLAVALPSSLVFKSAVVSWEPLRLAPAKKYIGRSGTPCIPSPIHNHKQHDPITTLS